MRTERELRQHLDILRQWLAGDELPRTTRIMWLGVVQVLRFVLGETDTMINGNPQCQHSDGKIIPISSHERDELPDIDG